MVYINLDINKAGSTNDLSSRSVVTCLPLNERLHSRQIGFDIYNSSYTL